MKRVLVLFCLNFLLSTFTKAEQIIVGVFENEPLMMRNENDRFSGLFIDILEDIARRNNIEVIYKFGTGVECRDWLISGEIDMIAETGNSLENQGKYIVGDEGIIATWANVYANRDVDFNTLMDLNDKKVAIIPESYFIVGPVRGFNQLVSELNLKCELVPARSYNEIFQMIQAGEVDAGVVNRIYGDLHAGRYDVIRTPIFFSPFRLCFGFSPKWSEAQRYKTIFDQDLASQKANNDSFYYQMLNKYMNNEEIVVPAWLWFLLILLMLGIGQLVLYVFVLRSQVAKRTSGLKEAFGEIQEREKLLSLIYNNTRDFIGLMDVVDDETYIVKKLPDWLLGKIHEKYPDYHAYQILNMEMSQFYREIMGFSEDEITRRQDYVKTAIRKREPVYFEEEIAVPIGLEGVAESTMIPICNKERVTHMLYVARDVTKVREMVRELTESEEKMRLAVQTVPVMLDAFDDDGQILVWNNKCEEVTGYSAKEMIGNPQAFDLLYPDEDYRNALISRYQNSKNYMDETVITCKDGTKCTISWIHQASTNPIPGWADWGIGIDVTERKIAESALLRSEQQLSSMMANLPGMAWRLKTDKDFTMLFVSEGVKELLNMTPEEFLGKKFKPRDFIMNEYHELVRLETFKSIEKMQPGELVIPLLVDGKVKWVLDRFKPVELSDGEIVIDGLLIDISDKLESEQRLQLAIEGAREGMWDWDIEANTLKLNQYAIDMLGFGNEVVDSAYDKFFSNLHPDDAEGTKKALRDHLAGVTDYYEKEYRLRTKIGNWKWIQTRGRVVQRNENGKPLRAMGTHIDIDIRKRAEIALKENELMLSGLMSNLPGMVYKCENNREWTMLFVSEGALELTGYSAKEFESGEVVFNDISLDPDKAKSFQEIQEAIAVDQPYTLVYRIRTKRGENKWVWEQGSRIRGTDLLEGFITDITDRVETEERIVSTVIETEDNERRRIAKELHDSLGQKLTTASLNLNSLKRDLHEDHKGFSKLATGLNSLNAAIRDSRDIAHNLMPRSIENFGYVPSVESMLAEIGSVSDIEFEFYENLNGERSDNKLEVHLYRITQEAVNNILKYSQAKKVIIQLMKYSDELILTIEDDGIGFDKEKVMAGSDNFGLRSMKTRVNSLSGEFNIDSAPNRGTIITVEIPAKFVVA